MKFLKASFLLKLDADQIYYYSLNIIQKTFKDYYKLKNILFSLINIKWVSFWYSYIVLIAVKLIQNIA